MKLATAVAIFLSLGLFDGAYANSAGIRAGAPSCVTPAGGVIQNECDPNEVAKAVPGYVCCAGGDVWRVESENGHIIYNDLTMGAKVTAVLRDATTDTHAGTTFRAAHSVCPTGYGVPTGSRFRDQYNGHWYIGGQVGRLIRAKVDHVVPGFQGRSFWTSTPVVKDNELTGYAYYFGTETSSQEYYPDQSVSVFTFTENMEMSVLCCSYLPLPPL